MEKAIQTVQDGTLREVLIQRYILGKKWEQISADTNYGYQWVCKLHGRALQAIKLKEAIESDTQSMI